MVSGYDNKFEKKRSNVFLTVKSKVFQFNSQTMSYFVFLPDVNECFDGSLNDCNVNAECTNKNGSYTCNCNNGYYGDGISCQGKNHCFNVTGWMHVLHNTI